MIAFHQDHNADLTMATIRVPISEAFRFGIVGAAEDYRVTSFVEKPTDPPSDLENMGVYLFKTETLNQVLLDDHNRPNSSHDFGKDILPRMIAQGARVFTFPYTGYWVDVGTVSSYWQAHMDQLSDHPPFDIYDRSWVIHTRTEERPPVWISKGAQVENSLITDGCKIFPGAQVTRSVLSPGVTIHPGAIVRESVLLTDTIIHSGAVVERAIIDKRVFIGEKARIGGVSEGQEPLIAMIGKNSMVPDGYIVEPGAMIATDVIESDYPTNIVRSDDYIQTRRLAHEV
jgi:glucose-1-phosphate adenylyltransferase